MSKITKVFTCDIKQVGEESDRVLRFIGSDETPDRDNDIIEVAGWNLDNYQKNPVFLWAHNYDEPPIGKAVNVTKDLVSGKLTFDVQFPGPEVYPFADTIYQLYKGGYLSATSVGFRGLKSKARDDESVNDKPDWMRGRRYMEQELLELSAVPVPSNPNALQSIRGKGLKDEDIDRVFVAEKLGAALSAKNRDMLAGIHASMDDCTQKLKVFLDSTMPMDPDDMPMTGDMTMPMINMPMMMPDMPMMTAMRTMTIGMSDEMKQVFADFTAEVRTLSAKLDSLAVPKAQSKEIDLDAIEFPKAAPNAADIALTIEPGELKRMIAETTREALRGGI